MHKINSTFTCTFAHTFKKVQQFYACRLMQSNVAKLLRTKRTPSTLKVRFLLKSRIKSTLYEQSELDANALFTHKERSTCKLNRTLYAKLTQCLKITGALMAQCTFTSPFAHTFETIALNINRMRTICKLHSFGTQSAHQVRLICAKCTQNTQSRDKACSANKALSRNY